MDPEAMHSLDFTYYVGSYDLAFILLDSVRAELVYGPPSAAAPSQAWHPLPLEVVSFSVT